MRPSGPVVAAKAAQAALGVVVGDDVAHGARTLGLKDQPAFEFQRRADDHGKDAGLAQFLRSGKPMPEGWAEIKDNIARVRQWSEEEQGFIERGKYIMPEDGATLINNHLGRSVLSDFAPTYILRMGGNLLNAMQLGFSAFHLGFTTLDASISKNALAIERLMHGEVGKAMTGFAEGLTPAGAVMNLRRGMKLMRAYADPSGATPEMAKIVQAGAGRVGDGMDFGLIEQLIEGPMY